MTDHPTGRPPLRDLHRQITDQLIRAIEQGPGQFILPWRRTGAGLDLPRNAQSGREYGGINILVLWVAAVSAGHTSARWATYRQWAQLGAQVRKGERSTTIVFYKDYAVTPDPTNTEDNGRRRVARASPVFNIAQVEGYFGPVAPPALPPLERLAHAEAFIGATGANISYGGDRAYFQAATDRVQMPEADRFIGTETMDRREAFYATLAHELIHWSGAKPRLDRDLSGRFGTAAYAAEELVAEIGAAFLCAELRISQGVRPDHARYLASWLTLLRNDPRAIFTAAARASEAARYLRAFSEPPTLDLVPSDDHPLEAVEHA